MITVKLKRSSSREVRKTIPFTNELGVKIIVIFEDGLVMVVHDYFSRRLEVHYNCGTTEAYWFSHPNADFAGFVALRDEIEDELITSNPMWKGVRIKRLDNAF